MKKIAIILFLIVFVSLISQEALSLGVSPPLGTNQYFFEPGMKIVRGYGVRNSLPDPINVRLVAKGNLSQYVTFDKEYLFLNGGGMSSFTVTINLPEKSPVPGVYPIAIEAVEEKDMDGIGARAAIRTFVQIRVEYPGKYVQANLEASNPNIGENAQFTVTVDNYGTEQIQLLNSKIEVYNPENQLVKTVNSPPITLFNPRETRNIKAEMPTDSFLSGSYKAIAIMDMDGAPAKSNNAMFKIGTLEIDIQNHTTSVTQDAISPFDIVVESRWNQRLEDVYAIVILDDGRSFRTVNDAVEPWTPKPLKGYLDAKGMSDGSHAVSIAVYYQDQKTEKSSVLYVTKPVLEKPGAGNYNTIILLSIVVIILVLINLIWLFTSVQNEKKKRK